MRRRILDAAASDDHRALGRQKQRRGLGNRAALGCRTGGRAIGSRGLKGVNIGGSRQHIARQVQLYRAAPGCHGHAERLAKHFGQAVSGSCGPGFLGDRAKQRVLVDLLECVAIDVARRKRSGYGDDRRKCGLGLSQASDKVGGAGAVLAGQITPGPPLIRA